MVMKIGRDVDLKVGRKRNDKLSRCIRARDEGGNGD